MLHCTNYLSSQQNNPAIILLDAIIRNHSNNSTIQSFATKHSQQFNHSNKRKTMNSRAAKQRGKPQPGRGALPFQSNQKNNLCQSANQNKENNLCQLF